MSLQTNGWRAILTNDFWKMQVQRYLTRCKAESRFSNFTRRKLAGISPAEKKSPGSRPGLGVIGLSGKSKSSTPRKTPSGPRANKADVWRDFHDRFWAMSEEEGSFGWLHATRLEHGAWALSGGPSEDFRARYAALATRAGIELGAPESIRPFDHFLEAVTRDAGGPIWNLVEASAIFCSHIELKALEKSASAPAVAPRKSGVDGKWFDSDPDILRRRQIVLKNPGMPAKSLCKLFDSVNTPIPLPRDWRAELRVDTWCGAYANRTGRKRIQKIISTDRRAGKT